MVWKHRNGSSDHMYIFEGNCVKDSMVEFEQTVERIKDIWTVKFSLVPCSDWGEGVCF